MEYNYLQSDKDREKRFLEWKEKHKGLTEEEQHRKAELTEEDLASNEALSNTCRNVSSAECLVERKKAFAAGETYKPQSIYNPVKDQAGYKDIERRLAETTPEADALRQIYNGYVQSFMQWGMSEENAKDAAGRRIGSEFILNGVVGSVALPKLGKVLDSVGEPTDFSVEAPKVISGKDRQVTVVNNNYSELIGKDFGKSGVVVSPPDIKISGIRQHYVDRKIQRGVKSEVAYDTVTNPKVVLKQSNGGYLFLSEKAAVAVSKEGKLITTYGENNFDSKTRAILSEVK